MRKLQLRTCATFLSIFLVLASLSPTAATESLKPLPEVPVKGMVTMLDLGAKKCIPCKMMAPILEELEVEFAGKLQVNFQDVRKYRGLSALYGIQVIPTQIFYDASGKELYRHEGFYSKEDIIAKWEDLGVDLAGIQ